jgi:hypothetical protein
MAREIFSDLDVNGNKIVNVGTPTANSDAANRLFAQSRIWTGTQAAYDAIGTKDPEITYMITDAGAAPSGPVSAVFVVGTTDASAITTGIKKAYWNVTKTGTITAWKIIADMSTTSSISVLKSTSMPTFSALGTASITAAQTATGTPSWSVAAGDIMDIEVLTNNNATKLVLEITIT